jgi:hypothetical protein
MKNNIDTSKLLGFRIARQIPGSTDAKIGSGKVTSDKLSAKIGLGKKPAAQS